MHRKGYVLLGITMLLLGGVFFQSITKTGWESSEEQSRKPSLKEKRFVPGKQLQEGKQLQRNHLSAMLHALKRDIVKIACEFEEYNPKTEMKSPPGHADPDCEETLSADLAKIRLDSRFADQLALWRFNKTLAIFGDPTGSYKIYLDSKQPVKLSAAYDGNTNSPERSNGVVQYLDLRAPQYALPVFDWVLTFLHKEPQMGKDLSVLVDNLVRHDRFGLVLVWTGSVETDKKAAVHQVLKKTLVYDSLKTRALRHNCRAEFKDSIFVYFKNETRKS